MENDLVCHTMLYLWDISSTFLTKHEKIKPMDLENNFQRMKKLWYPSTPIKDVFAQINDAN